MKVLELKEKLDFDIITLPDGEKEIEGVYAGDLLSWVMGRAQPDNAWVTIMTNINVLAVASLLDLSVVILAENSEYSEEFLKTAQDKEINVLRSPLTAFELCVLLDKTLQ